MPEFVRQFQPDFPVGYNDRDTVFAYLQISMLNAGYVPKMVFIDRQGIIRAQYDGADPFFQNEGPNIRAELDKLLKEEPARRKISRSRH